MNKGGFIKGEAVELRFLTISINLCLEMVEVTEDSSIKIVRMGHRRFVRVTE